MKFDSRLIADPGRQPRLRRTAWGFVTAAFWLFYLYLLAPLATLLLWLTGVRVAARELYLRQSHVEPLLFALPLLALGCAAVLIAWAEYNRFRFRGRDRRGAQPDVAHEEIARALGADETLARALSEGKSILLRMDGNARPIGAEHRLAAPA